LVSLLLPAVQAAREAARRAQCTNNLKQIGLGCLNCESAVTHMPAGGWTFLFVGHPDFGTGRGQPGGPCFNILPYVEAAPLYNVQAHITSGSTSPTESQAALSMVTTPLAAFICPSRRAVQAFTLTDTGGTSGSHFGNWICDGTHGHWMSRNASGATSAGIAVGRTDYCGNGGPAYAWIGELLNDATYSTTAQSLAGTNPDTAKAAIDAGTYDALIKKLTGWNYGIFGNFSVITMGQISDGTANTYLFGEKYINPDNYLNGMDTGDECCLYVGSDEDVIRWTGDFENWNGKAVISENSAWSPIRDTPGYGGAGGGQTSCVFGSPHVGGFNMVFCDGSVHTISFGIAKDVNCNLSCRNDGNTVDMGSLNNM
jgi:prepilin-type processing-associated H-X9-DG protein